MNWVFGFFGTKSSSAEDGFGPFTAGTNIITENGSILFTDEDGVELVTDGLGLVAIDPDSQFNADQVDASTAAHTFTSERKQLDAAPTGLEILHEQEPVGFTDEDGNLLVIEEALAPLSFTQSGSASSVLTGEQVLSLAAPTGSQIYSEQSNETFSDEAGTELALEDV